MTNIELAVLARWRFESNAFHTHPMSRPAGTPGLTGHLVGTGKVSFASKDAGRAACGSHKTLSALGRWFGFGLDEIFSGLVGSAGCKIPRTRLVPPVTVDMGHHYSTYPDSYGSVEPPFTGQQLGTLVLKMTLPRPSRGRAAALKAWPAPRCPGALIGATTGFRGQPGFGVECEKRRSPGRV